MTLATSDRPSYDTLFFSIKTFSIQITNECGHLCRDDAQLLMMKGNIEFE